SELLSSKDVHLRKPQVSLKKPARRRWRQVIAGAIVDAEKPWFPYSTQHGVTCHPETAGAEGTAFSTPRAGEAWAPYPCSPYSCCNSNNHRCRSGRCTACRTRSRKALHSGTDKVICTSRRLSHSACVVAPSCLATLDVFANVYVERVSKASGKVSWRDDAWLLKSICDHVARNGCRL